MKFYLNTHYSYYSGSMFITFINDEGKRGREEMPYIPYAFHVDNSKDSEWHDIQGNSPVFDTFESLVITLRVINH